MFKYIAFTFVFLISCLTYAQDRTSIEISDFDELRASGNLDVILKKGDRVSAEYFSRGIDEDMIVVESNGNQLKVQVKPGFHGDFKVKVYVTYTIIREARSIAGSRIYFEDKVEGDKLNLKATSGGLIEIPIDVNALEAKVDTGSEIEIEGKTGQLNASSATGGIFSGFKLYSEKAYLKAGTGGVIEVSVKDLIEASASTGGHIKYRGNPEKNKIHETLGGSVKKD